MAAVMNIFQTRYYCSTHGLICFHIVDKIIISQDSLKRFINTIRSGAYASVTKVDFKALDDFIIRPIGVYGSKIEIIRLLRSLDAVGEDMYINFVFFSSKLSWIITPAVVVCYFCQLSLVVPGQPYRLVYTSSLLERRTLLTNNIMSYIGQRTRRGTTLQLPQFVETESHLCGEEVHISSLSWPISYPYTGILRKYVIK